MANIGIHDILDILKIQESRLLNENKKSEEFPVICLMIEFRQWKAKRDLRKSLTVIQGGVR